MAVRKAIPRSHAPRGNLLTRRSAAACRSSARRRSVTTRERRNEGRPAYTLLEVMLALALTAITIALIGMAMHIHMSIAEKGRDQVEEAQLARTLLQRIADDLRNAVPYQPPAGSSSGTSASSSGGTSTSATSAASATVAGSSGTGATASSGTAASSSSSSGTGSSTMPVSGGLFGDIQGLQIETTYRPRLSRAMLAAAADGSQTAMLSVIRIVSYSLGVPTGTGTTGPISDGGATGGLYRSEMDRALFYMAQQQGQSTPPNAVELRDPTVGQVIDLKFSYYDGSNWNDEWDSNQQGKLPSAVKVALTIRSARKSSGRLPGVPGLGGASGGQRETVYDILVDLPNSTVPASEFQSLAQVDQTGSTNSMSSSSGSGGQGASGP